jgi:tetratricopeptide (TPR) repeat protein
MAWWKRLLKGSSDDPKPAEATKTPATHGNGGGCDHGAIELRQGTVDFEWFIARAELEDRKNLAHGARHLADLLAFDPANREWRDLLDAYVAAAQPSLDALLPMDEKRYYASEAVRAYAWQKAGRLGDATELLTQVVRAKTDAHYLEAWALDWLEVEGGMESLDERVALPLLGLALTRFPEARLATVRTLRHAKRWAALSERWFQGRAQTAVGAMAQVGLLRKAGEFDRALSVASASLDREPTWHNATALGLVLRERGEPRRAEEAFEQALRLDPTDVTARLEAGDTYFLAGDWESALRWYKNALAMEPGPWAHASLLYCQSKLSGDAATFAELELLANSGNGRAQELLYYEAGGDVHRPLDATAKIIRQLCDGLAPRPEPHTGDVKVSLSALEAPSNLVALNLELRARNAEGIALHMTVERVQSPDPRVPLEAGEYVLWRYEGTDPSPSLPPPSKDVETAISSIACTPGRADRANASRVAEALGVGRIEEILATIVHPPPLPAGRSALEWVPRVQRVVTSVLGQIDEGWQGSRRRAALYSLLLGPRDWSTIAAIRELGVIGRQEPAHAPDIGEAFAKLALAATTTADCPWEQPLYRAWLSLPHLFPNEKEHLGKRLSALQE